MTARSRPTRARIGRPPKPRDEVRRNRIGVSLTDAELAVVERRAEAQGKALSIVLHDLVKRALRRGSR